jgi:hypothetical protein
MRFVVKLVLLVGLVASGASLSPQALAAGTDTTGAPLTVTIDSAPKDSTSTTATVSFSSPGRTDVTFSCRLDVNGAPGTAAPCDGATPGSGTWSASGLEPATYALSVVAVAPDTAESDPATATWKVTAPPAAVRPTTPVLLSGPSGRTIEPVANIKFSIDQTDVTFECRVTGPGVNTPKPCSTGTVQHTAQRPGTYTFSVLARSAIDTALASEPVTRTWTVICSVRRTVCTPTAPGAYTVPSGAAFNNPLGTVAQRRKLLNHVTATVNSMPGYAVDPSLCSDNPADYPSTIRIALYSVTNEAFGRAMVAADKRCVSVQILMNNHLDPATTPAISMMRDALGTAPRSGDGSLQRSFARMCGGCRGRGVQHSKFYLFDSPVKAVNGRSLIRDTVMVGSSNMTGNASGVQWNTLYTVRSNAKLHQDYLGVFDRSKYDIPDSRTLDYRTGNYFTQFWPRSGGDPEMSALRSVRCTGANGGAGIGGRTVIYINMHAWFGTRGYALAKQVRSLYGQGCYVRILYSFMSYSVFKKLKSGTGSRMSVRRTLFSTDGDKYADVYSHFKLMAASGNIGGDRSAWISWTGSMNFTNSGVGFDEVMMRISSLGAYRQFRDNFSYISRRKSSSTFATFLEPIGGGRPVPEAKAMIAAKSAAIAPIVLPQKSLSDSSGAPLD